ncbi:MAG: hypothetical protein GX672_02740 [Synergistaceae bacterium]|nr:hypothetical protein [Synergistaceae bacterium]
MNRISNIMQKYACILLVSLVIFQTALVFISEQSIRYSLGPSSAKIMMNSIEISAAVTPTLRLPLSRLYRSTNHLFYTNQLLLAAKDVFDHFSFRPLPNILDDNSLTAEREHLFLPVLDLVLLI